MGPLFDTLFKVTCERNIDSLMSHEDSKIVTFGQKHIGIGILGVKRPVNRNRNRKPG